jgi:hypothetical protein
MGWVECLRIGRETCTLHRLTSLLNDCELDSDEITTKFSSVTFEMARVLDRHNEGNTSDKSVQGGPFTKTSTSILVASTAIAEGQGQESGQLTFQRSLKITHLIDEDCCMQLVHYTCF